MKSVFVYSMNQPILSEKRGFLRFVLIDMGSTRTYLFPKDSCEIECSDIMGTEIDDIEVRH